MTEMHDVVEMLLTRMKDYPEDFVCIPTIAYREANKWEKALNLVKAVAERHELDAIDIRMEEAKRAVYMGAALKTIMNDEPEPEEDKPYMTMKTQGRYATSIGQSMLNTKNTIANSIMIGGAQLTEDKIDLISELEAKQKIMEAQMQRQYALNDYSNTYPVSGSALG